MKINIPGFDFDQIESLINHFRQMDLTWFNHDVSRRKIMLL
jgi:hypothetical protein